MPFHFFFGFHFIYFTPQFQMERSYGFVRDPARDNVAKVINVRINIESKSMHGDPTTGLHAEGANFSWVPSLNMIEPYPCQALYSPRLYPIFCQSQYHRLLQ